MYWPHEQFSKPLRKLFTNSRVKIPWESISGQCQPGHSVTQCHYYVFCKSTAVILITVTYLQRNTLSPEQWISLWIPFTTGGGMERQLRSHCLSFVYDILLLWIHKHTYQIITLRMDFENHYCGDQVLSHLYFGFWSKELVCMWWQITTLCGRVCVWELGCVFAYACACECVAWL